MGIKRPGIVLSAFVLSGFVLVLARTAAVTPAAFEGKAAKEAAASLLTLAEAQAGKGSWERIGIGRVWYLSGEKEKGQAIFDQVAADSGERSDWRRIAKVYAEAKEFDKAAAALEKAVALKEEDTALGELAAMYNLAGQRDKAEAAFRRALAKDSDDTWNTIDMAGSYLGVRPHF